MAVSFGLVPDLFGSRNLQCAFDTRHECDEIKKDYREFNNIQAFQDNYCYPPNFLLQTADACESFRGGFYCELRSSSKGLENATLRVLGDKWPENSWFTETVALNDNLRVEEFPVGSPQSLPIDDNNQGYFPLNHLGLGSNSTLLNRLFDTGQIASHSWSMFWGRIGASDEHQIDGTLVLGGYDKEKIIPDQSLTQRFDYTQCSTGFLTSLTDIVLNHPNDYNTSLWGDSPPVKGVCIMPSEPMLFRL